MNSKEQILLPCLQSEFFRERDLRKLDSEREGMTDEEYQTSRKKLFAERTRVLKAAYDRKTDRLKRQTEGATVGHVGEEQASRMMNIFLSLSFSISFL